MTTEQFLRSFKWALGWFNANLIEDSGIGMVLAIFKDCNKIL